MPRFTPAGRALILLTLILAAGLLLPGWRLCAALLSGTAAPVFTPYYGRAFLNTLLMGGGVALAATLLGFVVAHATALTRAPGRAAMRALYLTPLFAPSVMPAIGLIYLVGSNGILMQCGLYGAAGVFWGGLVFALPHAVLQITLALETLDRRLLVAAQSLGAGWGRRMRTVVLPHAARGLMNAFLITFVLTVTDFGVPKLLGGSFPVLATEIYYEAVGSQDFATAALLSLWLLAPSVLAFWCSSRLKPRPSRGAAAPLPPRPNRFVDLAAGAAAWLIVLALAATIGVVIYGSFVTFWPYAPELTLDNYRFRSSTYGIEPWVNSLILATATGLLGTAAAFAGGAALLRARTIPALSARLYRTAAALPLCIPGTVLGLGFALAFSGSPVFAGAAGAMALLVFNTFVHLYTVPHLTALNVLSQIDLRYETVGRSLGVPAAATLRRVVIPLALPGLCEVFTYLFASAMTTISAVVFLYKPSSIVAAVAAIDLIDGGFISEGAAMATLIFLSALTVRLLTLRLRSK